MPTKELYQKRASNGKCVNCGNTNSNKSKRCDHCIEKMEYIRKRPSTSICKMCKNEFTPRSKVGVMPFFCENCRKEKSFFILKKLSDNPYAETRRVYSTEYARKWRKTNHRRYLDTTLRRKYGIALEEYVGIYNKQNGHCAICKKRLPDWEAKGSAKMDIHLDHDHKTKKIRGLLCGKCNLAIGLFEDSSETIASALWYLTSF